MFLPYEQVELGVLLNKQIDNRASDTLSDDELMRCVAGYCVAIDMTDRELQTAAKKKGLYVLELLQHGPRRRAWLG
jgi:2-keto-4-pentenoate hydratase/2-oxohepta-3-ene-1,7-dioic acid hydratase in catechol pathway